VQTDNRLNGRHSCHGIFAWSGPLLRRPRPPWIINNNILILQFTRIVESCSQTLHVIWQAHKRRRSQRWLLAFEYHSVTSGLSTCKQLATCSLRYATAVHYDDLVSRPCLSTIWQQIRADTRFRSAFSRGIAADSRSSHSLFTGSIWSGLHTWRIK